MALSDVIILGQYVPGNSALHRMDPRVKFLLATVFMIILFFVQHISSYLLFLALFVAIVTACGISWRYLLRGLRPILLLILFTFVVQALFSGEGQVILKWGIVTVRDVGLWRAIFMSLRLILLVLVTTLLTLATSPIDLTDGMDRLFSFLRRLRVPVHEIAMMMTIALRFIPTLLDETDTIIKAQISRGAPLDRGNIFRRVRGLVAVLVPLFIAAFRRADELAQAMEARCYRGGQGRTRMKLMALHRVDLLGTILALALAMLTLASNWLPLP
jgi:energy-coupling factor transport system permease protein